VDALFFLIRADEAPGVASSHDLPCEPVTDALRLEDPSPLFALPSALGIEAKIRPLRDATCRSFPVWRLGREVTDRLAALAEDEIDSTAERWLKHCETHLDADLYELARCLAELRDAVRNRDAEESLFVLLEERAFG